MKLKISVYKINSCAIIMSVYSDMSGRSGNSCNNVYPIRGSDWVPETLEMFDIKFEDKDFDEFFEFIRIEDSDYNSSVNEFLRLDIDRTYFYQNSNLMNNIQNNIVRTFLKDIAAVTSTHISEESAVNDFSRTLFLLLEYDKSIRYSVRSHVKLQLKMGGGHTEANPDTVIEDTDHKRYLIVQENKRFAHGVENENRKLAESQLIAEMIATNQWNSNRLCKAQVFGVLMIGTYPVFYRLNEKSNIGEIVAKKQSKQDALKSGPFIINRYTIPNAPSNPESAIKTSNFKLEIIKSFIALKKQLPTN